MGKQNPIPTFLVGLLVGGAVGAITALLLAPQSGAETRRQIREKGVALGNQAVEVYARAEVQAEAALGDLRAGIDELATKIDEMIAQGKARLEGDQDLSALAGVSG